MKPLRLSAVAAVLLLAACTASPTDSATTAADARPSLDGGGSLGSGNRTGDYGTGGATTQSDTVPEPGRGGGSHGGGN
jgi:hypothetical protein